MSLNLLDVPDPPIKVPGTFLKFKVEHRFAQCRVYAGVTAWVIKSKYKPYKY